MFTRIREKLFGPRKPKRPRIRMAAGRIGGRRLDAAALPDRPAAPEATLLLAQADGLLNGRGRSYRPAEAVEILRQGAAAGDMACAWRLAECARRGEGMAQDDAYAEGLMMQIARRAAMRVAAGHVDAAQMPAAEPAPSEGPVAAPEADAMEGEAPASPDEGRVDLRAPRRDRPADPDVSP
jgi:hypothetical protein